jgi:trigger factor
VDLFNFILKKLAQKALRKKIITLLSPRFIQVIFMSNYKTLSQSRISFAVEISDKSLKKSQKKALAHFRKDIEIKGFRKGQAPENLVTAQVGAERLSFEALNRAVDEAYRNFVTENKVHAIAAPKVDWGESNKPPLKINFEVEVFPEIKLGDYKKIKTQKLTVKVEEKEIDEMIEQLMTQVGAGTEVQRTAKDKDLLEVDFAGKDKEGKVLPNTEGTKTKLRLGAGQFLPDLEKAFVGMKPGENKTGIKVKFPKDYGSADFAEKTILFDIKIHTIQEVNAKKLDKATVEKLSGQKQSVEEFRKKAAESMQMTKERKAKEALVGDYQEKLVKYVKAELPDSWIQKEVEAQWKQVEEHPQYRQDPKAFWEATGQSEEKLKKQFAAQGEKNLKVFLGLSEIVKVENIELNKNELEQAHKMAHQHLGHDQHDHPNHDAEIEKASLNLKIDKYLQGLML